jgi:hypothetical protein
MAHQVFICHSGNDKLVADAACAALEANGIRCWIAPRDVLPGMAYMKAIVQALNECTIVLLIFSQEANKSPHVHREIERAVSKEKVIVPFRIENVLPTDEMEFALSSTQWLDALTPPMEQHLAELNTTISRLLQRPIGDKPLRQQTGSATKKDTPQPNRLQSWGLSITIVLFILWLLGLSLRIGGMFIHLLPIIGVIVLTYYLLSPRRKI